LKHFISYIGELLIGLPAERYLFIACTQATQRGGFAVLRSAPVPFKGEAEFLDAQVGKEAIQVQQSMQADVTKVKLRWFCTSVRTEKSGVVAGFFLLSI
jgi:hypothetical protein